MRTFIFIPPVKKATGGVAVLGRIAMSLLEEGHSVTIVPREEGGGMYVDELAEVAPVVPLSKLKLTSKDLWFVPEGWVNALLPGLNAGARSIVYCQNWAYLFSSLPKGVDWGSLDVSFLSVSEPVRWYIQQCLGMDSPILRPGINLNRFHLPDEKANDGPIRVAYMPRKNKALADQIRSTFNAFWGGEHNSGVRWMEIENMDADRVGKVMRDSHIFLATGFPEGCPLPPLEAMASGCLCVGFPGFGGWDYMRQAGGFDGASEPWFPLRDVSWGPNGFWCADADILAAAFGLSRAVELVREQDPEVDDLIFNSMQTASNYSDRKHKDAVVQIWKSFGA